jgi:ribosome-associated protein
MTTRESRSATTAEGLPSPVERAIEAARDKKAIDVALLDLRPLASFTDFFVICSGSNPRQVQAIAEAVEERLRHEGLRPSHIEGFDRAEWILLDYFDFIVHVFSSARREFYALERLWGSAARVEI